jgi:RNA polymerase sporulation-specific sigma factor
VTVRGTDEQLAARASNGDTAATDTLIRSYRNFAYALAADFHVRGSTRQDIHQEALIGLWHATVDYRPEHGMTFKSFAAMCVRRRVISSVTTANRLKHQQLTNAVRALADDTDAVDLVPAGASSQPDRVLEDREELALLLRVIGERLSPLERECLVAFANGEAALAIQARLGEPILPYRGRPRAKVVENALDRAKQKLRAALDLERAA